MEEWFNLVEDNELKSTPKFQRYDIVKDIEGNEVIIVGSDNINCWLTERSGSENPIDGEGYTEYYKTGYIPKDKNSGYWSYPENKLTFVRYGSAPQEECPWKIGDWVYVTGLKLKDSFYAGNVSDAKIGDTKQVESIIGNSLLEGVDYWIKLKDVSGEISSNLLRKATPEEIQSVTKSDDSWIKPGAWITQIKRCMSSS